MTAVTTSKVDTQKFHSAAESWANKAEQISGVTERLDDLKDELSKLIRTQDSNTEILVSQMLDQAENRRFVHTSKGIVLVERFKRARKKQKVGSDPAPPSFSTRVSIVHPEKNTGVPAK